MDPDILTLNSPAGWRRRLRLEPTARSLNEPSKALTGKQPELDRPMRWRETNNCEIYATRSGPQPQLRNNGACSFSRRYFSASRNGHDGARRDFGPGKSQKHLQDGKRKFAVEVVFGDPEPSPTIFHRGKDIRW